MQAIIINKDFFECDRQFVYDFLTYGCNAQDLRIFSLNKKCPLYKEHIAYSKENELVWKYATSGMDIYKTVVKKNNKGSLEISKKRSGTNNEYIIALSDFTKEYIDGTVLSNYLSVRNRQEKIEILTKYFDYIFSKYINPKTAKLPGYFFDMTPPNIIVNNDGFHIIDSWVSLKDYPECDKCFAIYAAARFEDEELYNYFVEKYKLNNEKEKYDFYLEKARKNLDKLQNNSSFKMQKNIDKYFNDRAFMPEYKL